MSGLPEPPPPSDSPVSSSRTASQRYPARQLSTEALGAPVARTTFYTDVDQPTVMSTPGVPPYSSSSPAYQGASRQSGGGSRILPSSLRSSVAFGQPAATAADTPPPRESRTLAAMRSSGASSSASVFRDATSNPTRASTAADAVAPSRASRDVRPESSMRMSQHMSASTGFSDASPDTVPVEEKELLSEILYTWSGVKRTKLFTFDEASGSYTMTGGSTRQRNLFETIGDCGPIVRQIENLLQSPSQSFLQQSLKAAISRQVAEYAAFVGSLRQELDNLTIAQLSIARLKVQPKLSRILKILIDTEDTKGGDLATKLQMLNHQGSRRMLMMLSDIYIEAVSPLLQMTLQWITSGEVPDPYDEFFIQISTEVRDDEDTFWTRKFSLRQDMLPINFKRVGFAEKVLAVGKNINFIRRCCRVKGWRVDKAIQDACQRTNFENVSDTVEMALTTSNESVMKIIREQFKIEQTLRLLHQFMLVSNAAFFETLVFKLEPVLSRPASKVQVSIVQDVLNSTLQEVSSLLHGIDIDAAMRIVAHVDTRQSDSWDAFVISFRIPAPLNNVFDRPSMLLYRQLFRMLFRVKRAEVSLKRAWRESVALDRVIARMRPEDQDTFAFRDVAKQAFSLRLELNHFVTNLRSYLVTEVTTAAWEKLLKQLASCTSLDDVRDAHEKYLKQLELYTLLHQECQTAKRNVDQVLHIVRRYCTGQLALTNLIERGLGDVFEIKREFQSMEDDFHREIASLMSTLEEQHLQFDFLNFLLLRLNFNKFYRAEDQHNTDF